MRLTQSCESIPREETKHSRPEDGFPLSHVARAREYSAVAQERWGQIMKALMARKRTQTLFAGKWEVTGELRKGSDLTYFFFLNTGQLHGEKLGRAGWRDKRETWRPLRGLLLRSVVQTWREVNRCYVLWGGIKMGY